jgi:hypothetical protein
MEIDLIDSVKIDKRIEEIHKMIDLKEIFYSLWDLMNKIEIDFEFYHDPVIMSTRVKIKKYTISK